MLDVDEHRAAVGRQRCAGDFAVHRAGQETADLAGAAVTREHLVVADASQLALVHLRRVRIGLDPQHPTCVEQQAVRASKDVALDVALRLGACIRRVASEHQVVPAQREAIEIAVVLPADDLPHHVVGARVCGIHPRHVFGSARAVVGQRAIDVATFLVDRNPLRAVHLGRTQQVARLARLDHHFALVGKAVRSRQRPLAVHQRQPAPSAVGVEARDMERAMVEQLAIRLRRALAAGGRLHGVARDELVDVFEPGVFARIHHRTLVARQRNPRSFMCGAAERGALDGRGVRVHRVDLDDPAEAVEFVRVFARVEAFIVFRPAVKTGLANAPALLVRIGRVAAIEVEREVLFARQVGAPGRDAAGAVVQRAQHGAAGRVGGGAHQRVAGRRAAHREGRIGGEAARVNRRPHHRPAGLAGLAGSGAPFHLDHRDTMRGLCLANLLGAPGLEAVAVQQAVVGVFVVHCQQPTPRAVEGVVMNAVVVHAHLHRLVGRAVAAVAAPGRHVAGDADRLAPGGDRHGHVAFGNDERVVAGGRHRLEAEQRPAAAHAGAARQQWPQHAGSQGRQTPLHPEATRRVGHVVNTRVERGVAQLHRFEVFGHDCPSGGCDCRTDV